MALRICASRTAPGIGLGLAQLFGRQTAGLSQPSALGLVSHREFGAGGALVATRADTARDRLRCRAALSLSRAARSFCGPVDSSPDATGRLPGTATPFPGTGTSSCGATEPLHRAGEPSHGAGNPFRGTKKSFFGVVKPFCGAVESRLRAGKWFPGNTLQRNQPVTPSPRPFWPMTHKHRTNFKTRAPIGRRSCGASQPSKRRRGRSLALPPIVQRSSRCSYLGEAPAMLSVISIVLDTFSSIWPGMRSKSLRLIWKLARMTSKSPFRFGTRWPSLSGR